MNKKHVLATVAVLSALGMSAQEISTENKVLDCGQVVFQQPVTMLFELKNSGDKPLIIDNVHTSCGCTTTAFPRTPIAAGEAFTISATYDSKTMGHFSKQIGIYSNASNEPFMLSLRGMVVEEVEDFGGQYPYALGDLLVDHNNIEFDDVNRGDRPYQQIHVKNASSITAQPVIMHLPDYLSAEVSPSKIAPGHSGVITISLDSRSLRDFGLTQTSVFLGAFPGDRVSHNKELPVSAVLLPAFINMTDTGRVLSPKLSLSAESLDLGRFEGKTKKRGEIDITNKGRTPLTISSLQMFTTGLEVSLNKTEIAPGETAKLKVTAKAKELKAARSKPRVLMITNDPDRVKVVIEIKVE